MPTVHRVRGPHVVIYPNDHRPAHVHVKGTGGEAVFVLNCPEGPPVLRQSYGFSLREVNGIADALLTVLQTLCTKWRSIHGHY
ncbi:DUF4160 domain-containing protein [Reyranella sp.]|uniref:DUF4160 domain-containing protein n=1 Tax=Reyranella sp. TaxID=1929291 RepID=UPI003D133BE5